MFITQHKYFITLANPIQFMDNRGQYIFSHLHSKVEVQYMFSTAKVTSI